MCVASSRMGRPSSNEKAFGQDFITYRGVNYDAVLGTDDVFYHSFSVKYSMPNGLDLLLGVANAFDKHPPKLTGFGTPRPALFMNIFHELIFSFLQFNSKRYRLQE